MRWDWYKANQNMMLSGKHVQHAYKHIKALNNFSSSRKFEIISLYVVMLVCINDLL